MKRIKVYTIFLTLFALVAILIQPATAKQDRQPAHVEKPNSEIVANIIVPQLAIDNSNVIFLGSAVDNGTPVQGYAIIHYKKEQAKPDKPGNGKGGGKDSAQSCYGLIAKGARWKVTENYVVANNFDAQTLSSDLEIWDSQVAFNIFGNEDILSVVDGADLVQPDGKNEFMFGEITDSGAIAVTIVWGVFGGPPQGRKLVEYDMVFDNVDYIWGDATIDPLVMDFENIAVHEIGHAAGLGDLYQSECSEQTMYGYAAEGETKKRTLEAGDIAGIRKLY